MDIVLLIARLLLAAVFATAGLAKLADGAGSRRAMRGFGVPAPLAGPLGTALPIAELITAVALVPVAWTRWGALAALALLLVFVAAIGVNLARGRRPDCHCFGQLHSEPVGWSTLARNAGLAAVAALVFRQGAGMSAMAWLGGLSPDGRVGAVAGLAALALLLVEGWVVLQVMGQNGRLMARLDALEAATAPVEDLAVGSPAPAFALPGLDGLTTGLDALRNLGKPVLLVFSDPNCGPCNTLLPQLGRWQRDLAASLTVAIVSRGTVEANLPKAAAHGLTRVLLQEDREVAIAYRAGGTPAAVVIQPDGTIGTPLAFGPDAVRALVARVVGAPSQGPRPRPGHAGSGAMRLPSTPSFGRSAD